VNWFIFLFQMVFLALAVVLCYATFLQNQPRFFIKWGRFSNFMIFLRGIVFPSFFRNFCDAFFAVFVMGFLLVKKIIYINRVFLF